MALTATATFRTSSEFKKRIDNLAKETKRSAGFFYNLLLEEHLDELEDIKPTKGGRKFSSQRLNALIRKWK